MLYFHARINRSEENRIIIVLVGKGTWLIRLWLLIHMIYYIWISNVHLAWNKEEAMWSQDKFESSIDEYIEDAKVSIEWKVSFILTSVISMKSFLCITYFPKSIIDSNFSCWCTWKVGYLMILILNS
jgi:hypothetical protein